MSTDFNSQIQAELGAMGPDELRRVLEFARSLRSPVVGTPGNNLLEFVGTIAPDDLRQMQEIIEQGCERIDADEW